MACIKLCCAGIHISGDKNVKGLHKFLLLCNMITLQCLILLLRACSTVAASACLSYSTSHHYFITLKNEINDILPHSSSVMVVHRHSKLAVSTLMCFATHDQYRDNKIKYHGKICKAILPRTSRTFNKDCVANDLFLFQNHFLHSYLRLPRQMDMEHTSLYRS